MMSCAHSSSGSSSGSASSTAPCNASGSGRSLRPANETMNRCWCGRAARISRCRPSLVTSTAPGAIRSVRSVCSSTTTSPRTPWGLAMRPTSSTALFDELDVDLDAVAHRGGAHHGADRLGDPTALADDATHVPLRDVHLEAGLAAAVEDVDLDAVGLFDHGLHEVLEDGHRGVRVD